jgi:hypothetical protein
LAKTASAIRQKYAVRHVRKCSTIALIHALGWSASFLHNAMLLAADRMLLAADHAGSPPLLALP